MCAHLNAKSQNPVAADDEAVHITLLLRDLETALSLGAPREVIGSALELLSRSLALHARRTRRHRDLLRRLLGLRGDWRRGGTRLERRTLNGLKAGWEIELH